MLKSPVEWIVRMMVQDGEITMYVTQQNHHYLLPYEHHEHHEHHLHGKMKRNGLDHFSLGKTAIGYQRDWLL